MKSLLRILFGAALLACAEAASAQAPAPANDDPWSHVINMATAGTWNVQPPGRPRPSLVDAAGQSFHQALRVQATAGTNPWDQQATSPTGGDIPQGSTVMVMVFARAQTPPPGGASLPMRLQIKAAPYTALFQTTMALTDQFKAFCGSGVAQQDFPADSSVVVHLATNTQTVDLGPVFVFNFGPNYDPARLPHCPGS